MISSLTMEALRFDPDTSVLSLERIDVPQITDAKEVLVEVKFSGLCGTDIHIIKGEFNQKSKSALTLGHEFCGVVVDSGSEAAKKFPKGTRVGLDPNRGCFKCAFCKAGQVHFCPNNMCYGVLRNGGFAKYALVIMEVLTELPKNVSYEQGALCEPLSCLLHGWKQLQKVGPPLFSDKILIIGAGIIGNLWSLMFYHSGFRNIIVSELNESRRNIAKHNGFGFVVVSPSELEAKMSKNQDDIEINGFDIIIDCTGVPKALETAFKWTRRGARVCIFGCAPVGQTMSISPEEVFKKELTIFGTLVNPYTYPEATRLASSMDPKFLNLKTLGVKTFKLAQYREALDELKSGNISKAMFEL